MNKENKSQADIRSSLNPGGMRVTRQRTLLLEIIRQGGEHLDAAEIYRRAREKQPDFSLSTVYRTLNILKKLGLVEEVHFDDSHHHYEVPPADEHHHLVCVNCGKVVEFQKSLSRYIKKNVVEAKDFEIINTELVLTGYCPDCRKEMG